MLYACAHLNVCLFMRYVLIRLAECIVVFVHPCQCRPILLSLNFTSMFKCIYIYIYIYIYYKTLLHIHQCTCMCARIVNLNHDVEFHRHALYHMSL